MMTNFKNIHVTRSSLIASMKKAISIVLVMLMMFSLAACGNSSDNTTAQTSGKENRVTTEEEMSTQERAGDPIDEPNQEIDEGVNLPTDTEEDTEEVTTEAPSNPQPQGKYTYTIYDGIEISMDVNVDDYIVTNKKGDEFFHIYELAESLGWEGINPDEDGDSTMFSYQTNEGAVMKFEVSSGDDYADGWDEYEFEKIDGIYSDFTTGAPDFGLYYDMNETGLQEKHTGSSIIINPDIDAAKYGIGGAFGKAASRDEVILIAYVLWEPTAYDGESNIYYLFDEYRGNSGTNCSYYIR